jgi:multisubunit Na+/H+ antiporter MnhE subunit
VWRRGLKKKRSPGKRYEKRLTPGMIAMIYAVVGGLWIAASDTIVQMLSNDADINPGLFQG